MAKNTVVSIRMPLALYSRLVKLALLDRRKFSDYVRLKLEEIAKQESLAATGGQ